jgi:small subunit ribosomal protein S4
MSRYTGPKFRIARHLGYSLRDDEKDIVRNFQPGKNSSSRTSKPSEYSLQLKEKQKVRFTYGMGEKQFKKFFLEASKLKGKHGENFIKLLESRLDNIVYRLHFASSRPQARQLVNHGHILVDGKKVDIPSYRLKAGQTVSLRDSSKKLLIVEEALTKNRFIAPFLNYDDEKQVGVFVRYPERDEVLPGIHEQLIVEFYNR